MLHRFPDLRTYEKTQYVHLNQNPYKTGFYSFFQAEAVPYPNAGDTLLALRQAGIKIGVLTDVAYGMDNKFSLRDIAVLSGFIDVTLTSVDVGYRKPNSAGFQKLMTALQVSPDEMMYVGDEQKDIFGANQLDAFTTYSNPDFPSNLEFMSPRPDSGMYAHIQCKQQGKAALEVFSIVLGDATYAATYNMSVSGSSGMVTKTSTPLTCVMTIPTAFQYPGGQFSLIQLGNGVVNI